MFKHEQIRVRAQVEYEKLTRAELQKRIEDLEVEWSRWKNGCEFDDIRMRMWIRGHLNVARAELAKRNER